MAVGTDQGAVEADVGSLESGHHLQLGGDEILLHDVVLLVQVVHDGQLHPVGALVVLKGAAADEQVQAFAGDGLAQGLLGLLHAQVGQQIVNGELGVLRRAADRHGHGRAVLQGHHAAELQGDSHPLVLADTAVIVGLEKGQLRVLIERVGLEIQPGGVDVGRADVDALAEGPGTHHGQHQGLAPVDPVQLVARIDRHAAGEGLEALSLRQAHRLGYALPLRLACVQKLLVVLTIGLHIRLVLGAQAVVAVLGLVEQRLAPQLSRSSI